MQRAVFGLALLALGLCAFAIWDIVDRFDAVGPARSEIRILVARGDLPSKVAVRLEQMGVIENSLIFRLLMRVNDKEGAIRAGEYDVPAGATPRDVLQLLTEGPTVVRKLTVPEGSTTAEVLAIVDGAVGLVGETPQSVAEGTLLPETYHYSWGDTREQVIGRMEHAMREVVSQALASRSSEHPVSTPLELITLASIIEKETSVSGERSRVAGVFINRLNRGMLLQSDPTTIYAITRGEKTLSRRLTYADLKYDDPYNTYSRPGLPPGPIANPGRASLMAAANPLKTEELYFVADGSGGHVFSRSLLEHNRNVARWRRIQRERGFR